MRKEKLQTMLYDGVLAVAVSILIVAL